ncbi:1,2-dihydroxy-3-keto-5-methylthiopentene dioxygenase [Marasmius crinis-equi]|uniref:1,2-dihydroxy-3-keto-5-methylthiopentene dioxygenase n=1 Tax=Marasmius crinis-equi TaxID=585013 RepID=A0ABR3FGH5_9AGAR
MRAYYRDLSATDLTLPHDTGRTVLEERFRVLKLKFWTVKGTDVECEKQFRAIGEDLGFVDGTRKEVVSDFAKLDPKSAEEQAKFFAQDVLVLNDVISFIKEGKCYYDFKDPETNDYIRILMRPGRACFAPEGTIVQRYPYAETKDRLCIYDVYKTAEPLVGQASLVPSHGQDLRSDPVRVTYLKDIGVA